MKRFLVFGGLCTDFNGGFFDCQDDFNSKDAAMEFIKAQRAEVLEMEKQLGSHVDCWSHLVDTTSGRMEYAGCDCGEHLSMNPTINDPNDKL